MPFVIISDARQANITRWIVSPDDPDMHQEDMSQGMEGEGRTFPMTVW